MEKKIATAISVVKGILATRPAAEDVQKITQSILNLAHATIANDSLNNYADSTSEMDEELTLVLGRIRPSTDSTSLVQLTQAALNLMNARVLLTGEVKKKKSGASAS